MSDERKRYRVYLHTIASTCIEVDAADADEAKELAYEEVPSLCAHCSGWGQSAGIELADWSPVDEPWPLATATTAQVRTSFSSLASL